MGEGLKHIIGSLSEGGFEGRMSTGSETFPLLICLDANKSVLASVFSLIDTICQRIWAKPLPKNENFYLRWTVHRSRTPLRKPPYEKVPLSY